MVKLEKLRGQEQQNFFAPYMEKQQEIRQQSKTDRKAYFKEYNDRMKQERKLKRLSKKQEVAKEYNETKSKYYGAEAIRILMSFKEYTELNKDKKKLGLDFNWTLKDCKEAISKGYGNVVAVMKLAQVADKLIKDYGDTAKNEIRKGKSGNVLSEEEKSRLIKYGGREKANIENSYIDEDERLERQGEQHEKEIEIQKLHEERGKKGCKCGQCEEKTIIQQGIKTKIKKDMEKAEKEIDGYGGTSNGDEKEKCEGCDKVKKLDNESGLCKTCSDYYN